MDTLTTTLPPELTDYTIDFLHQDVLALRACALVCRSWLPSSRYHLFPSITLTDAHTLHSFAVLIASASAIDRSSVNTYIRTLTLEKSYDTSPTCGNASWEISPLLLTSLPPQLPNLRTLRLSNFLSFWMPSSFKLSLYASFKTVRNIELVGCSFNGIMNLKKLMEGFQCDETEGGEVLITAYSHPHILACSNFDTSVVKAI